MPHLRHRIDEPERLSSARSIVFAVSNRVID